MIGRPLTIQSFLILGPPSKANDSFRSRSFLSLSFFSFCFASLRRCLFFFGCSAREEPIGTCLLGFTHFYWVLLGLAWFYWVLLGFTGFYWVFFLAHRMVPSLALGRHQARRFFRHLRFRRRFRRRRRGRRRWRRRGAALVGVGHAAAAAAAGRNRRRFFETAHQFRQRRRRDAGAIGVGRSRRGVFLVLLLFVRNKKKTR